MTKQYKTIGRIGVLTIKRIPKNDNEIAGVIRAKARKIAISEVLTDFINVPKSPKKIEDYIKQTGYMSEDTSLRGTINTFIYEQLEVKQIVEKVSKNQIITNPDKEKIAAKLENLNIKIKLLPESEFARLNEDLYLLDKQDPNKGWVQNLDKNGEDLYFIKTPEYTNHRQAIWYHLLRAIETKRPLKQCGDMFRCRKFFFPHLRTPNQQFCSSECEDRVRKRNEYKQKKALQG